MPWRNCCAPIAATAQTAPRLPFRVAVLILVLVGVGGFSAIVGHLRRRLVVIGFGAVSVAIAGLILAGTTLAATTVSSQFRHAELARLMRANDEPAAFIKTGCLKRRARVWECSAAVFDSPQLENVAVVYRWSFRSVKGSGGYSGPKGARWVTTLPGVTKGRHLAGSVVFCGVGQPMRKAAS